MSVKSSTADTAPDSVLKSADAVLRAPAEVKYAAELAALAKADDQAKPEKWRLSPKAVRTYLLGGKLADGTLISAKYIGDARIIEIAIATLMTDRALLLLGVPGTAKSWVSEHLAAAISGNSTLMIQGTAGTDEQSLRYGWNYAELIAKGPSDKALVESPMLRGMRDGALVRVEELTRINAEVQDTLITLLSEKTLPVPELNRQIPAVHGFNVIATANNRDRGVNELSSALMRRFNTVVLPTPASLDEEISIVEKRVAEQSVALKLPKVDIGVAEEIRRVVQVFRELRSGATSEGVKIKSPTGTLSTAEAISVVNHGLALCAYYGDGQLRAADVAAGIMGAVIKDPLQDHAILAEYLKTAVREREGWKDFYRAMNELL
jgi:MoxR-like ATPase